MKVVIPLVDTVRIIRRHRRGLVLEKQLLLAVNLFSRQLFVPMV